MSIIYLILFASFIAPLPIMVIEWLLPYPSVIEEIFSVIIVLLILKQEKILKKNLFIFVVLAGILFSISESFLYLNNIIKIGNYDLFIIRLIFTTLIHTSNIAFIYLLGKKGVYWLLLAFIIAVVIHFIYNNYVVYYIVEVVGL